MAILGMRSTLGLIVMAFVWPIEASEASCGKDAKSSSLLSLKADIVSKTVEETEEKEHVLNGTVCLNCSNHTGSNQSLENLIKTVLTTDMNQTGDMPDPVANDNDTAGSLGQNLEFLYMKVAQLETAVELQNIEFKFAKQDLHQAQLEIQTLKDRLDHKDAALKQVNAKLLEMGAPVTEEEVSDKHRAAWLKEVKATHQKRQETTKHQTQDILKAVFKKHHRQTHRSWGQTETPKTPKTPTKTALNEVLAERAENHGQRSDLDRSVSSKGSVPIVDDIVDAGEDVVDAVVDGTDLVGDALSDAYNAAADKAAFVANTVIDTVEQAMAILTNDFDFSANCPNWNGPSLSVDNNGISVDWGRQRCRVTLVGQSLTLFDMNFGSTNVNFPDPLTAMIDVGKQVAGCLDDGNALNVFKCVAKTIGEELLADVPAFKILFSIAQQVVGCTGDALDVFACTAKKIGDILLQTLPPFNILTNLGTMLSEFVAFFAELASALIHTLLSETSSLMQEAVSTTFPRAGEKPLQMAGPKGLTAHVRRQKAHGTSDAKKAEKPSFLQREASASQKPSNDVDSGIIGFGTTEAQPYASMLITQFGGDEFDSGSCLAFAPSHRSGSKGSNVTQRDWQVPSPDSADFVKLEPWAVPCDNQWAKDNPSKWEGYSFYTYESVIEKCAAITYSMSAQPVISFVGGLEFDILPAPLIEITTEVCWPDRVTAPDLSLMVFTARSAGIVLFTHTIRLHKRFGENTDFTAGHFKDSIELPRNYFGKGEATDDDKALQVLSRAALTQSNATEKPKETSKNLNHKDFEVKQEKLFLASAKYDHKLGLNITARYEGAMASKRLKAAMSKNLAALQDNATDGTLGVHELFELASPSGSLVGFSIKGQLSSGHLQLKVRINFGPIESPTKTIPLIDLVDNLRVVLAALPFVSQASKEKAIDAMSNTNFDAELPSAEVQETLTLKAGIVEHGGRTRDAIFERKDGICSVQAVVDPSTWGEVATLPADCHPREQLIFNLQTNSASGTSPARVDVATDGVIQWVEGSQDTWLSLSGLIFPLTAGWPMDLKNDWTNAAAPYAGATYTLVGSLCFLEGRIEQGKGFVRKLAQLPVECRPTKRVMFAQNVGNSSNRIDVLPDGEVKYVRGQSAWVSLSGIVFSTTTAAQQPLELASGWVTSGGSGDVFGIPTYSNIYGHCLVEGRIFGSLVSGGGLLGQLPVECWPMRQLIFSQAYGDVVIEVDVSEFGEISYNTDTSGSGTISLAGIIFGAPSDGRRMLPTVFPWEALESNEYGEGSLFMKNGFCMLEGRVLGINSGSFAAGTTLATLPEGCQPTKRLTFNLNSKSNTHSVDVTVDGQVLWMGGSTGAKWVSFSGLTFTPGGLGRITLPLLNGWTAYGGDYGIPEVTKRNGICSVEGRLREGSSWGNLAQLPAECAPSKKLIFNMNNFAQTSRVDVTDDGLIKWYAGGTSGDWISLSGMIIAPDESNAVPLGLLNGWSHYGSGYGEATYVLLDGICVIQGMIRDGTKGVTIAVLPEECRPRQRLVFNLNVREYTGRVDVQADGSIIFVDSADWKTAWLSLTGISFAV